MIAFAEETAWSAGCAEADAPDLHLEFAFQPVIGVHERRVVGFEALPQGVAGETVEHLLEGLPPAQVPTLDQRVRSEAIAAAAGLGLRAELCVDLTPARLFDPERCIRATLDALSCHRMRREQVVLELSEREHGRDDEHVVATVSACRELGLRVAIDEFGAGHSGLNLLSRLEPDRIKFAPTLVTGVDRDAARQAVVRGILIVCRELGIEPLANGVTTGAEFRWLRDAGIDLFQGEFVGAPALGYLPAVDAELFRVGARA